MMWAKQNLIFILGKTEILVYSVIVIRQQTCSIMGTPLQQAIFIVSEICYGHTRV